MSHRDPARQADLRGLVERAQLGSSSAFEELVREFGPRLHRFLIVRLGHESDARDALQETLIAAWQGLPSLKSAERLWPWLAGIAAHKAVDAARKRPRAHSEARVAHTESPMETIALKAAIAALPRRLKEVLLLRYLASLSEQETAEALGIRIGTVKSRAARARERIEKEMRHGAS